MPGETHILWSNSGTGRRAVSNRRSDVRIQHTNRKRRYIRLDYPLYGPMVYAERASFVQMNKTGATLGPPLLVSQAPEPVFARVLLFEGFDEFRVGRDVTIVVNRDTAGAAFFKMPRGVTISL